MEQGVAGYFSEPRQPSHVVPESDEQNPNAGIIQSRSKSLDLGALAGTVNPGETHQYGAPVVKGLSNHGSHLS
jgi:hypothetical protein